MSAVLAPRAVALPRRPSRIAPVTRWSIGMLGLVVLLGAGVLLSRLASDPVRFPVSNVDVLGTLDYTDRAVLQNTVGRYLDKGFYGLDIAQVRGALETLPWVATARVSRVWPARLSVDIEEHEPAARWNDAGIVSKQLALFDSPQLAADDVRQDQWLALFDSLPRLTGTEGRHADVLADFQHYQRALAVLGVSVEALEEDDRRSQSLTLSDNVTVRLGYAERELRLARFVDIYERLVPQQGGRELHFDMRYSNGFALSGVGDVGTGEGEPK